MRFYANSMADLCEALGRDVSQLIVPHRGKATTRTIQGTFHREILATYRSCGQA